MTVFAPWQQRVFDGACSAFAEGRLGHALLLQGPPMLGKALVARSLAQRLLCRAATGNEQACGHCLGCRRFLGETHGDYRHLSFEPNDKGDKLRSEIVIDQIRGLGQWFSLTPQLGGAQVAIIEPADAVNFAANNALLKTLEEPSANRYLLLVTSKPSHLPATIRSRCQRLEFRVPPREESAQWLRDKGHTPEAIDAALAAARGHPGLADDWLARGGLQLRRELLAELNAVAANKIGPAELAQRWLADDQAELRLRFAAELALEAAQSLAGATAVTAGGLTTPKDFMKLSAWFDAMNRTRELLRVPVRNDLVLAGLLREWRTMAQDSVADRGRR